MPFLIYSTDKPDHGDLRNEVRAEHLAYLQSHIDRLLAGGAVLNNDSGAPFGSAIILDTEDQAEAEQFAANDPFTKAGLFESVVVTRWRKAIFDGNMMV